MDKTKAAAAYKDLVDKVRDDYLVNPRKNKSKSIVLNWCDDPEDNTGLCQAINLWTYWQGRGYANETPEIDYLLVGQDLGFGKSKEESIINKRYPNLFFTNFCLGYRRGDQIETGKMTKQLMKLYLV